VPTSLKSPQDDPGNRPNVAAIIFVALLVVGCIWLFNKLNSANNALNCVASGRHNCDQTDQ
jgi:hypothetical protein